jgi:5'-deoxynucleotidase YfbR-like HD superfamily hydrolase
MDINSFNNFLQVLEFYKLKQIPRNSSNHYYDEKSGIFYERKETTAEHVFSCLRLGDFFLTTESEFSQLNRLKVYDLLMYHDDIEILTRDTGISEREKRIDKEKNELEAVPILSLKLPQKLDEKFICCDAEYRAKATGESKFANGVDKMDSLIHEFQYPLDWGPKGFDEKNVRAWFQPAFEYSPTFVKYFEATIRHLNMHDYFKK